MTKDYANSSIDMFWFCPFNDTAEPNILIPLNTHINNHPLPMICPFNVTAESNILIPLNTHPINHLFNKDFVPSMSQQSQIFLSHLILILLIISLQGFCPFNIPLNTHPINHPLTRILSLQCHSRAKYSYPT